MKQLTLKQAKRRIPVILCPYCEWTTPYTKKISELKRDWFKHLEQDNCYLVEEE